MLHRALPAVAVVLIAALAGCEAKLTEERYESIKPGMTIDQVFAIIGEGERQEEGQASSIAAGMLQGLPGAGGKKPNSTRELYIWKEDRVEISVTFDNGKVVDKNQRGLK